MYQLCNLPILQVLPIVEVPMFHPNLFVFLTKLLFKSVSCNNLGNLSPNENLLYSNSVTPSAEGDHQGLLFLKYLVVWKGFFHHPIWDYLLATILEVGCFGILQWIKFKSCLPFWKQAYPDIVNIEGYYEIFVLDFLRWSVTHGRSVLGTLWEKKLVKEKDPSQ